MPSLKSILKAMSFVAHHPLNHKRPGRGLPDFLRWQLGSRLVPGPVLVPLAEDTFLFARPGLAGATGTAYTGLHDFEDMSFLLHLLREGESFFDVGANIGSYTILAAGVAGASVSSFEPAEDAATWLLKNVAVNHLESRVELHRLALGKAPGTVRFTTSLDTINHVTAQDEGAETAAEEVRVDTLDNMAAVRSPTLIKLDVEGFEHDVLLGSRQTLRSEKLLAVIIEMNGSGLRYGHEDRELHALLVEAGLSPYAYDPFSREIQPLNAPRTSGNTLYLRRPDEILRRVRAARHFQIGRFGSI